MIDRKRLRKCGATEGEATFLLDEYATSDLVVQGDIDRFYRANANPDIRHAIARRRAAGHFSAVVEPPGRLARVLGAKAPERPAEPPVSLDEQHGGDGDDAPETLPPGLGLSDAPAGDVSRESSTPEGAESPES